MIRGRPSIALLACAMPGLALAQPPQGPIAPAWFVGMWSDHEDCSDAVDFRRDGTFRTREGGEGRWTLDNDMLSLTGSGGDQQLNLRRIGPNQLSTTNAASNETGSSWRCKAEGSRDNRTSRPAVTMAIAPVVPPPPLTREFLIGRWGVGGTCDVTTITFAADGTASPPTGTRWQLAGNIVSVTTPGGQPEPATITVTGPNGFRAVPRGDDQSIPFVRCPAAD